MPSPALTFSLAEREPALGGALTPSLPVVGASPFTYTNTGNRQQVVTVTGGVVSTITYIRNGVETLTGLVTGMVLLNPGEAVRIAYTVAPVLSVITL